MKILMFYGAMQEMGGGARMFACMANQWAEKHSVTIATMYGNSSFYDLKSSVEFIPSPYKLPVSKIGKSLKSSLYLPLLLKNIKRTNPDIVIVNNGPYYVLLAGTICAKIMRKPFIIWKHNGFFAPSSKLYKLARKLCFPLADAVVLLTKGDEHHAKDYSKKTYTIHNPCIFENIRYQYNINSKTALFIGRLIVQKTIDHLINAWKNIHSKIPDWNLLIVGEGECRSELEELSAGEKSIIFAGETDDVEKYYQDAGFFVMSSMHEGLPLVLIEALAFGLPCVSYNCKYGPAEIIDDGKNGILVENGNTKKLEEAILRMATDEQFRLSCSKHSLKKLNEFSMSSVTDRWERLFEELEVNK